ncbi:hypothetical protein DTO271G3_8656 [Paecilomyces variotii]|nr:hypothetical protein DTO271G3_8656 [Paecilomyces variotii]
MATVKRNSKAAQGHAAEARANAATAPEGYQNRRRGAAVSAGFSAVISREREPETPRPKRTRRSVSMKETIHTTRQPARLRSEVGTNSPSVYQWDFQDHSSDHQAETIPPEKQHTLPSRKTRRKGAARSANSRNNSHHHHTRDFLSPASAHPAETSGNAQCYSSSPTPNTRLMVSWSDDDTNHATRNLRAPNTQETSNAVARDAKNTPTPTSRLKTLLEYGSFNDRNTEWAFCRTRRIKVRVFPSQDHGGRLVIQNLTSLCLPFRLPSRCIGT